MATYVKGSYGWVKPKTWTEPCMNCDASVTYQERETITDPLQHKSYIICPCCGKMMNVHFYNIRLC